MKLVVTRPQADGERTAQTVRKRGHEVLLAPLMQVQSLPADLSGAWGAVAITSANAPPAIAGNPARAMLLQMPLYAVGHRSADAARAAGFSNVISAGGNVRDLVRLIGERHADVKTPLLYLAGEDRAADLIGALAARDIAADLRVVYRAVTLPYPPALTVALQEGAVDGVLHFSQRSAENYLAGARAAGLSGPALAVAHYCLSAAIAAPLSAAGAERVAVARQPSEAALIELLPASTG